MKKQGKLKSLKASTISGMNEDELLDRIDLARYYPVYTDATWKRLNKRLDKLREKMK